jgi:hypothetical protein
MAREVGRYFDAANFPVVAVFSVQHDQQIDRIRPSVTATHVERAGARLPSQQHTTRSELQPVL